MLFGWRFRLHRTFALDQKFEYFMGKKLLDVGEGLYALPPGAHVGAPLQYVCSPQSVIFNLSENPTTQQNNRQNARDFTGTFSM